MAPDNTVDNLSQTVSRLKEVNEKLTHLEEGEYRDLFSEMERIREHINQQELQLRESEARFRALVSASAQVLYRMSPDWSEMRHLQDGDFLSNNEKPNPDWLSEYIHPNDQQWVLEVIRQAVQTGSVFELEHRFLRGDGTIGWTYSRAVPVRNPAGEIIEWFGAASDITGRKQAEETLARAYKALESRGEERAAELATANMQLQVEIEKRRHAESAIADELRDTRLLHALSMRLVSEDNIQALYDAILDTAIALTNADAGTVQILDNDTQELHLLVTRGFLPSMVEHFARVDARSHTSCGMALATGMRVFVDFDNAENEDDNGSMRLYVQAGLLSTQSTPLTTRSGRPIGMVSTHWRNHYRPGERELRFLDLLARQAADLIERAQAEAALRESEQRFRNSIENLNEAFMILTAVRENDAGEKQVKADNSSPARGKVLDFRWVYVNDATCKLYERTPEQITGRRVLELFPEQAEMGLIARYAEVVETGNPFKEVIHYISKGTAGPQIKGVFDIRASKFGDGVIVTANEITEQVRLEAQHREARIQMEIHHRLMEQRERDRQTIARDIHDGPIQTLSSIAFSLQFLRETFLDPGLRPELDQIGQSVKSAVQELRQVINELRPPAIIRFGLAKAVMLHADEVRERSPQINWHYKLEADDNQLSEDVRLSLFRIYQEAVNNIINHSEASRALVCLRFTRSQVVMDVQDNGKGFSENFDVKDFTDQKHFGLAGIFERAEAVGGRVKINTKPAKGTKVEVRVPVNKKKRPKIAA